MAVSTERECARDGCLVLVTKPRKFCSHQCSYAHYAVSKACVQCGVELPRGRRQGYATCSDKCANARRQVTWAAANCGATKPCEVCGAEMRGAPSALANRKTCSPECLHRRKASRLKVAAMCVVCGAACAGGRKTCGPACFTSRLGDISRQRSTVGARSEQVRAKRRKHSANAYKGKDKADIIARLMVEQGGRCAVCFGEGVALGNGTKGLVLDHCHTTGRARSLLCTRCNAALGQMREDPTHIESLLNYARRVRSHSDV